VTTASPNMPLLAFSAGRWQTRSRTVHWRLARCGSRDPSTLARRWIEQIVREEGLFPWRGFAPTGPRQKPRFAGAGPNGSGPDFSVSHSRDVLLVAVINEGKVGVDVEAAPFAAFDSQALTRRMCSPCEGKRLRNLKHEHRRQALSGLWTAKEALAKAGGHGLALDFRTICVAPPRSERRGNFDGHLAVVDDGVPVAVRLVTKDSSITTATDHTEILGAPGALHTPLTRSHVCKP